MQTVIKDLPLNEEMDSNAMATIQGGRINLANFGYVTKKQKLGPPSDIDPMGFANDFILPQDD